jgi:hypothetical protein
MIYSSSGRKAVMTFGYEEHTWDPGRGRKKIAMQAGTMNQDRHWHTSGMKTDCNLIIQTSPK